jgi:hypothetical protein
MFLELTEIPLCRRGDLPGDNLPGDDLRGDLIARSFCDGLCGEELGERIPWPDLPKLPRFDLGARMEPLRPGEVLSAR